MISPPRISASSRGLARSDADGQGLLELSHSPAAAARPPLEIDRFSHGWTGPNRHSEPASTSVAASWPLSIAREPPRPALGICVTDAVLTLCRVKLRSPAPRDVPSRSFPAVSDGPSSGGGAARGNASGVRSPGLNREVQNAGIPIPTRHISIDRPTAASPALPRSAPRSLADDPRTNTPRRAPQLASVCRDRELDASPIPRMEVMRPSIRSRPVRPGALDEGACGGTVLATDRHLFGSRHPERGHTSLVLIRSSRPIPRESGARPCSSSKPTTSCATCWA